MAEVFDLPTKEQFDTMNAHLANISIPDASKVTISDTENHYTSGNVEGALQEVGEQINSLAYFERYGISNVQSIPNATWTNVVIDVRSFTASDKALAKINAGKIEFVKAGIYDVFYIFQFGANATGFRGIIEPNNLTVYNNVVNGALTTVAVNGLIAPAIGSQLNLQVYQNSGSPLDLTGVIIEIAKRGEAV